MYITIYLSLNSALACWYSECKKDILLSFFLIQGLPLIALAAWLFLPVYISAKVTQYLQWDLNSSCCFFSKFNIQYSISLKQIVSLSLQARHNNTRLFLGVHSTRVSGKEVWGPKDPNLHEFVVSTPLYRYKISGTKNIKQKKNIKRNILKFQF